AKMTLTDATTQLTHNPAPATPRCLTCLLNNSVTSYVLTYSFSFTHTARAPRGRPYLFPFSALPEGLREQPAEVQRGHVLLRELEGLLIGHAALLQRAVEARDRGPELRGCVLAVDRIREAVQERGQLLREDREDLFHLLWVHAPLFPCHFLHLFVP